MRYLFLLIIMVLSLEKSMAQTKAAVRFNSYNSLGILVGKSPAAFTAQTVNGLQFKKWFAGVGFGIDNYSMKTLPLFVDVKREFTFKKAKFFLYADAGSHFVTTKNKVERESYSYNTRGKLYLDAGLGFKISTSKKNSIFLTAGNSFKKITQTESLTNPSYPSKNETVYKLSTISFRLGYQW